MASATDQAPGLLKRFAAAVEAGSVGEDEEDLLVELKLALTQYQSLPPIARETANAAAERIVARTAYEYAALFSILQGDGRSFDRHYALARGMYTDFRALPPSKLQGLVTGVNLMHLLVENRLADFHSLLEVLDDAELKHECVLFPVSLDEALMEGRYNKVLDAMQSAPSKYFSNLVDSLKGTVRDEIAHCSQKAYTTLPVESARKMMLFDTQAQLLSYVSERHPEWTVTATTIHFKATTKATAKVPSKELIKNTLMYATELERIV